MPDLTPMMDRGWLGVDMRLAPHLLPAGFAAEAVNMRFTDGVPETRLGLFWPPWLNKLSGGAVLPWTTLQGAGIFSDPLTRLDWLLLAADGKIYRCLRNNAPLEMPLPAGVTLSGEVTFTQAANRIICHRGFDLEGLWCEDIHGSWSVIPDPAAATGASRMPNLERSIYAQGRLWGFKDDDTVACSDFNDPTSYLEVQQEFFVNPGESSRGVALFKWGKSTIVIFKERSIHVIYNAYGTLGAITNDTLTLEFGCVAPETIVDVGNELWFLANDGVVRSLVDVGITDVGRLKLKTVPNSRGEDVPFRASDPILPLMNRCVATSLSQARAALVQNRYYLALPVDDIYVWGNNLLNGLPFEYTFPLIVGAVYRYERGIEPYIIHDGDYLTSSRVFTATADSGEVGPSSEYPPFATGTVRKRLGPCNTAIAIYDFINGAWSGYDLYPDFGILRILAFPVGGRQQLLGISVNGHVALFEQGYGDLVDEPYAELRLDPDVAVEVDDSIQINGGATISAALVHTNSATAWGIGNTEYEYAVALANLFSDSVVVGGYYLGATTPWSAPNTRAELIVEGNTIAGVRIYGTNGVFPRIVHSVHGLTVTYYQDRPIAAVLTTRGYSQPGALPLQGARLATDLQTWNGLVDLEFIPQGVSKNITLGSLDPDRTKYYRPAGQPAFVESNVNGDFAVAHRQDYSVQFGDNGTTALYLASGDVRLDLHQQVHWAASTPEAVDWTYGQTRLTCTRGRMRVLGHSVMAANLAGETDGATD